MVEPIEPQPKSGVTSPLRRIYTASGASTPLYYPPAVSTGSLKVVVGGREVAQNDPKYSWELDADGNVLFTNYQPKLGDIVTIESSLNSLFLDLTKQKYPKGYALDSRALNRSLTLALNTANLLAQLGDDTLNAWIESGAFPSADTGDDLFAVTDNGAWSAKNIAFVNNVLGTNDVDNTEIIANSVSSTSLSADNFYTGTLYDTSVLGASASIDAPFADSDYRIITFNATTNNIDSYLSATNTSGIEFDTAGSAITITTGTEYGGSQLRFDTSGLYTTNAYEALNPFDDPVVSYNQNALSAVITDKSVILTDSFAKFNTFSQHEAFNFTDTGNFQNRKPFIKASNIPICGFQYAANAGVNLSNFFDADAYFVGGGFDEACEVLAYDKNPTLPLNNFYYSEALFTPNQNAVGTNVGLPTIQSVDFVGIGNPPVSQVANFPLAFKPILFVTFSQNLLLDLVISNTRNLPADQDPRFVVNGNCWFSTTSNPVGLARVFTPKIDSRCHIIGSPRYNELATEYNNSRIRLSTNNQTLMPTNNTGSDMYRHMIIELYRYPDDSASTLFIAQSGTYNSSNFFIDANFLLYLTGDSFYQSF